MKYLNMFIIGFILVSQTIWFVGCTKKNSLRTLHHKVNCKSGEVIELNIKTDFDHLELDTPVN